MVAATDTTPSTLQKPSDTQALAQRVGQVEVALPDISASITDVQTAMIDGDQALASRVGTLETNYPNISNRVTTVETAVSDLDSGLSARITSLETTLPSVSATATDALQTASGYCPTGQHLTRSECIAAGHNWVNASFANAMRNVSLTVGGKTVTAGSIFETLNDNGTLKATGGLYVDNNGVVSGVFIGANPTASNIVFKADTFEFQTQNGTVKPVQISGNQVSLVNVLVKTSINVNDNFIVDANGHAELKKLKAEGVIRGGVMQTGKAGFMSAHQTASGGYQVARSLACNGRHITTGGAWLTNSEIDLDGLYLPARSSAYNEDNLPSHYYSSTMAKQVIRASAYDEIVFNGSITLSNGRVILQKRTKDMQGNWSAWGDIRSVYHAQSYFGTLSLNMTSRPIWQLWNCRRG